MAVMAARSVRSGALVANSASKKARIYRDTPPALVGRGLLELRVDQGRLVDQATESTGVFGSATVVTPLVTDSPSTGVYSWLWSTCSPVRDEPAGQA